MKCARLHLQKRSTLKIKSDSSTVSDKPRRYCQKRMINPEHEEDPRWIDLLERYHCNSDDHIIDSLDNPTGHQDNDDLFLTVQTLQFPRDVDQEQLKRPRTSFKYKTVTDGNKHRMFVKESVTETDYNEDDRSSRLTCYYFDDYVKYLFNNDKSRPNSCKSGMYLRGISAKLKENKATQVDIVQKIDSKKTRDPDYRDRSKICLKNEVKEYIESDVDAMENAKVTYRKSGKRKSITISRTQSPETVQVIRVDVVCNYNSSSLSNYEDNKNIERSTNTSELKFENESVKNSNFVNRYLLTNSVKPLDENLSGGAKVTLLCKTFKLTDRAKIERPKFGTEKTHTRATKDDTRNYNKLKSRKP